MPTTSRGLDTTEIGQGLGDKCSSVTCNNIVSPGIDTCAVVRHGVAIGQRGRHLFCNRIFLHRDTFPSGTGVLSRDAEDANSANQSERPAGPFLETDVLEFVMQDSNYFFIEGVHFDCSKVLKPSKYTCGMDIVENSEFDDSIHSTTQLLDVAECSFTRQIQSEQGTCARTRHADFQGAATVSAFNRLFRSTSTATSTGFPLLPMSTHSRRLLKSLCSAILLEVATSAFSQMCSDIFQQPTSTAATNQPTAQAAPLAARFRTTPNRVQSTTYLRSLMVVNFSAFRITKATRRAATVH